MNKARIALKRIIHWITRERLPEFIIFGLVGIIMYLSVFSYFVTYIKTFDEKLSYNFEMPILSATLGGFVLIGGFLENTASSVKNDLLILPRDFLQPLYFLLFLNSLYL